MRRRAIRRGAAWMAAILLLALLPYQTMAGSSSDTVPAQKTGQGGSHGSQVGDRQGVGRRERF